MRIALDISQMVYEGTGVARFTEGLVHSILDNDKKNYWIFFCQTFRRKIRDDILQKITDRGFSYKYLFLPPKGAEIVWNQLRWISADKLLPEVDWFITSDWTEPPTTCKKATIVHDLIFRKYPNTVDSYVRSVMERKIPLAIKEDSLLFVDSMTTKLDLEAEYKVSPKKVIVNYPGVNELKSDSTLVREAVFAKYNISKPFFITVGKTEPRKNIHTLIKAFKKLNREDVQLVIAGQKGWGPQDKPQHNVEFLGFVPDEELSLLYSESIGMIFPSLYEGFGYPALEAMMCGTATALSDTSSLAEIGKGAALYFDPHNIDDIASKMQLLFNEDERKKLIVKGREKAREYTWKRYLSVLLDSLQAHS